MAMPRAATSHAHRRFRCWMALPGGAFHPFQLRERKAELLHLTGRWDGLDALTRQDRDTAQAAGDASAEAGCLLRLGKLATQRGDLDAAERLAVQAERLYSSAGDHRGIYEARTALAKVFLERRQLDQGEAIVAGLLREARAGRDDGALCEQLNYLGLICVRTGRPGEAVRHFQEKLDLARRLGKPIDMAVALGNLGTALNACGRTTESIASVRECLALCRRTGDQFNAYCALYNLAKRYEETGRTEDAARCYREDLRMALQLGDGGGARTIRADIARVEAAGP